MAAWPHDGPNVLVVVVVVVAGCVHIGHAQKNGGRADRRHVQYLGLKKNDFGKSRVLTPVRIRHNVNIDDGPNVYWLKTTATQPIT